MSTSPTLRERLRSLTDSRAFTLALVGIGILFIACIVFEAGMYVGFRKATYSARLGNNYTETFGPHRYFLSMGAGMPDPHGAVGQIVAVSLPTITIENPQNAEQIIQVATDTLIRSQNQALTPSTLTTGEYVIVLGVPNGQGQVDAKLIRVIPPPAPTTTP